VYGNRRAGIERVPTILCLICELIMKGSSAAFATNRPIAGETKPC
jgi:hypothetical protein